VSILLTYWEDPLVKYTEDDFDSIITIVLKSVNEIPQRIVDKPKNCTMISIERSAPVLKRDKSGPTNPLNSYHFKELWRKEQAITSPVAKRKIAHYAGQIGSENRVENLKRCFYCRELVGSEYYLVEKAIKPEGTPRRWQQIGYCCIGCETKGELVRIDFFKGGL